MSRNTSIPKTIPAKAAAAAPFFASEQDDVGVGVTLAYNCDNEIVKFYSYQVYCSFLGGAGNVGGQPNDTTSLSL